MFNFNFNFDKIVIPPSLGIAAFGVFLAIAGLPWIGVSLIALGLFIAVAPHVEEMSGDSFIFWVAIFSLGAFLLLFLIGYFADIKPLLHPPSKQ
jgi:uncharacterized membrane protein YczE